ncbi:MAG: four helix bundle protein [Planctomycetaceae bacterium]|nr:four helix bundle protein [Planctomycetaceae bacterium]
MAGIKRVEEIQAWQKACVFVREVYRMSTHGPLARDFGLRDQLRRAAISIMANIAEGFARGTDKDFPAFLISRVVPPRKRKRFAISHVTSAISSNKLSPDRTRILTKSFPSLPALPHIYGSSRLTIGNP